MYSVATLPSSLLVAWHRTCNRLDMTKTTQTAETRTFTKSYGITLRCYTMDLNPRDWHTYSELRSYIVDRTHNIILLGRFAGSALDQYSDDAMDACEEQECQSTMREHATALLGQLMARRIEDQVRASMARPVDVAPGFFINELEQYVD